MEVPNDTRLGSVRKRVPGDTAAEGPRRSWSPADSASLAGARGRVGLRNGARESQGHPSCERVSSIEGLGACRICLATTEGDVAITTKRTRQIVGLGRFGPCTYRPHGIAQPTTPSFTCTPTSRARRRIRMRDPTWPLTPCLGVCTVQQIEAGSGWAGRSRRASTMP
jgi:hypothetical protein